MNVSYAKLSSVFDHSGKSDKQIGSELGLSEKLIHEWRIGVKHLPDAIVHRLAFTLGVSPESLLALPEHTPRRQRLGDLTQSDLKPSADPLPKRREALKYGVDGMPMMPSTQRTYCSCGRKVR